MRQERAIKTYGSSVKYNHSKHRFKNDEWNETTAYPECKKVESLGIRRQVDKDQEETSKKMERFYPITWI